MGASQAAPVCAPGAVRPCGREELCKNSLLEILGSGLARDQQLNIISV